ncbi:LacI family DNA-binding transcriptional regulator [Nonomuraea jabiensis]|uniref:LacI family DNA-binding transcriptional regulator n=1 Tax=Nonomuraea jabiensis TaxID=882448 RepID=UPI003D71D338
MARHAGVSQTTVSYVINGKRNISKATRERVAKAIAELGYHPHLGAKALASRRSNVIAVTVPLQGDKHVPLIAEIVMEVAVTARRHGRNVLLLTGTEAGDDLRGVTMGGAGPSPLTSAVRSWTASLVTGCCLRLLQQTPQRRPRHHHGAIGNTKGTMGGAEARRAIIANV